MSAGSDVEIDADESSTSQPTAKSLEQSFVQQLRSDPVIPNFVVLRDEKSVSENVGSNAGNLGNVLAIGALMAATIFGGIALGVQYSSNNFSTQFEKQFGDAIEPILQQNQMLEAEISDLKNEIDQLEEFLPDLIERD